MDREVSDDVIMMSSNRVCFRLYDIIHIKLDNDRMRNVHRPAISVVSAFSTCRWWPGRKRGNTESLKVPRVYLYRGIDSGLTPFCEIFEDNFRYAIHPVVFQRMLCLNLEVYTVIRITMVVERHLTLH